MTILGKTLPDLDVADLDTAKKIEAFYAGYETALNDAKTMTNRVKLIETVCNAVFKGLDELFGEDTAKHLFGDKTNISDCVMAVNQMTQEIKQADGKLGDELTQITKSTGNRAARRSAAKTKK